MSTQTIEWIKNNPAFCTAPHAVYDFRFDLDKFKVTTCCNLDVSKTDQALDFNFIENVKQDMSQGLVPDACWRCASEEQNQAQSERVKYLLGYTVAELEQFKKNKKTNEFQVGMKFSNLCNLACRSCNETDSSLWSKLMNRSTLPEYEIDTSTDEFQWNQMTNMIRAEHEKTNNFYVHPIGGETMIQPGFAKLIDWLITENLASTTGLRITTSLVPNIADKFLEKFVLFRRVDFLSSIDSVGENYHYVRWPAQFNKIEDNLKTFVSLNQQYPGKFGLNIGPVFSLNNIFYAVDCLTWWENWADQTQTDLCLSNIHLYNPEMLMVETLPIEYRSQLMALLDQCVNHNVFKKYKQTDVLREYFSAMKNTMQHNKTDTETLFKKYLTFTADYDNRTNTNSYQLNSKLFDLLSDNHRNIYDSHLKYVQSKI